MKVIDSLVQFKTTVTTYPPQKSILWWGWMSWLGIQMVFQWVQSQFFIGVLYLGIALGSLPLRWTQQQNLFYRRKDLYTCAYLMLVFLRFGWFLIQSFPVLLLQAYSPTILWFHLILFSMELIWIPLLKRWRFNFQPTISE